MRRIAALAALLSLLSPLAGCSKKSSGLVAPGPTGPPRTFRMGFSPIPPKADQILVFRSLELWTRRADAGIMHVPPPWDSLLAGKRADSLVIRNILPIANYYRGKRLDVVVTIDVTDGLNRAAEAPELVAAGRSITEAEVQRVYRRFATVLDSLVRPSTLLLAAETNLIRAAASASIYSAVVQMANGAAVEVRAVDLGVKLGVSVQVETAWGAFGGGGYQGIATDLADFPFMQAVGLSSYPYLGGFSEPESVPLDYYSRLVQGTALPVLVVEGGWTSASLGGISSSPAKQARYIRHQMALLDSARAIDVFQLTFTDLDTTSFPPGSILPLFAHLGLVDEHLAFKPALAAWDSAFGRARR